MKQKFTTWAGFLLVALAVVAIGFTSCNNDPLYDRDPNQDFETEPILEVVVEGEEGLGPFEFTAEGGSLKLNVTSNAIWVVSLPGGSTPIFTFVGENKPVTGNGSFEVQINEYTGRRARTGDINVNTDSVSVLVGVNQAAPSN